MEIPRNCSGWKSDRNPATTADPSKIAKVQKWGSSEVAIMENTFRKYSQSRKIGKAETLVIVAGGNLEEIRPLLTLPQK